METIEEQNNISHLNIQNKEDIIFQEQLQNCDHNDIFHLFLNNFVKKFLDLQELRKFISYLFQEKKEMIVKDIFENFNDIKEQFKNK